MMKKSVLLVTVLALTVGPLWGASTVHADDFNFIVTDNDNSANVVAEDQNDGHHPQGKKTSQDNSNDLQNDNLDNIITQFSQAIAPIIKGHSSTANSPDGDDQDNRNKIENHTHPGSHAGWGDHSYTNASSSFGGSSSNEISSANEDKPSLGVSVGNNSNANNTSEHQGNKSSGNPWKNKPNGHHPSWNRVNTTNATQQNQGNQAGKNQNTQPSSNSEQSALKQSIQQSLSAYHQATIQDASVSNTLAQDVTQYVKHVQSVISTAQLSGLTNQESNIANALGDMQTALQDQNQVQQLYGNLKTASSTHDLQGTLTALTQMTSEEQAKIQALNQAVAILNEVVSSLS